MKQHAKVHSFRITTALLVWVPIAAALLSAYLIKRALLTMGLAALEKAGVEARYFPWWP